MWIIVLFDLPTDTKRARKAYSNFRGKLLDDGFVMMQYSVYMRHCPSIENAKVHGAKINKILPNDGEVRIVTITDSQFARIEVFHGKRRAPIENAPEQISFF